MFSHLVDFWSCLRNVVKSFLGTYSNCSCLLYIKFIFNFIQGCFLQYFLMKTLKTLIMSTPCSTLSHHFFGLFLKKDNLL